MKVSEKQALLNVIKDKISSLELDLQYVSVAVKTYYKIADKDDPSTHEYFQELNKHQTAKRQIKSKIARYARIAKQLKVEITNPNKVFS